MKLWDRRTKQSGTRSASMLDKTRCKLPDGESASMAGHVDQYITLWAASSVLFSVFFLIGRELAAQPAQRHHCNRLLTIQPGRNIIVETRQPKRRVNGTFV